MREQEPTKARIRDRILIPPQQFPGIQVSGRNWKVWIGDLSPPALYVAGFVGMTWANADLTGYLCYGVFGLVFGLVAMWIRARRKNYAKESDSTGQAPTESKAPS